MGLNIILNIFIIILVVTVLFLLIFKNNTLNLFESFNGSGYGFRKEFSEKSNKTPILLYLDSLFIDSFKELTDMLFEDKVLRAKLSESKYIRNYAFTNQFEFDGKDKPLTLSVAYSYNKKKKERR